jgi:hypothetical protein
MMRVVVECPNNICTAGWLKMDIFIRRPEPALHNWFPRQGEAEIRSILEASGVGFHFSRIRRDAPNAHFLEYPHQEDRRIIACLMAVADRLEVRRTINLGVGSDQRHLRPHKVIGKDGKEHWERCFAVVGSHVQPLGPMLAKQRRDYLLAAIDTGWRVIDELGSELDRDTLERLGEQWPIYNVKHSAGFSAPGGRS